MIKRITLLFAAISFVSLAVGVEPSPPNLIEQSTKAYKLQQDGNFKEAFEIYQEILANPEHGSQRGIEDIQHAYECLRRLNRLNELDAFLEKTAEVHSKNWRMINKIANVYSYCRHYGYMIAGKFERGSHRGGGKYVNVSPRDRVRSLQLLDQARALAEKDIESDPSAVADFYMHFAAFIRQGRGSGGSWRLQYLTDLSKLPDYEDGNYYSRDVGTPVDADGKPVYYKTPKSWEKAKNDGERWRWLLMQAMEIDSSRASEARYRFATFMQNQFGVQTMARYSYFSGRGQVDDDGKKDESGTYALHTLKQMETITRLASGIKRHTLPDEFNYIKVFQAIAEGNDSYAGNSLQSLAQIFENRRQYVEAAEYWQENIERFGPGGNNNWKQKRLKQITGNWGRFDGTKTHVAGEPARLGFVFRNGEKVSFTAKEVDVKGLLEDIKSYLKSDPKRLDGNRANLNSIGYDLVNRDRKKYVGKTVANWDLALKPRDGHWDRRIDVVTPLKKAGAYLLSAKMEDGNESHVLVWINDTVIVKKTLSNSCYYFLADADTGKPIKKINVEFFGYKTRYENRRYHVDTLQFAEFSDDSGQVIPDREDQKQGYNWLLTATDGSSGRLAYLGFSSVWYRQLHDAEYKATKVFTMTDRPVYRPSQKVYYKCWVRNAQYDKEDVSQFAGREFRVEIRTPRNEKIYEKTLVADAYGGINDELMLDEEATLGSYRISVYDGRHIGSGHFRVEEYKKPEFEVTVDAPDKPVMLGEKIKAKVAAKYYFGAPVTEAKVKYKVLRYNHNAQWYPCMPWDWFYGPGYWWFAYDYDWYPGWDLWGCGRPWPWWWNRGHNPPEVVSENEVEIGKDGQIEIEIDTSLAKAMHGDIDHRYEITAEVVDASRRTIVGRGSVLVARQPFKVYLWPDRGYYRVGDVIHVSADAHTLDNKPVEGKGKLTLYQISYSKKGEPKEKAVQEWELSTDVEGRARKQIKASKAGQYRLAYNVTDKAGHKIEGAYMLVIRGQGFDSSKFRFNALELVNDKPEYRPGDKVELMINTEQNNSTVLFFVRPANGICLKPEVLSLDGKSAVRNIDVTKKDMPNFFVEAVTVSGGKVYTEVRELVVPPEKRVLNVEVEPSKDRYKPGEKAKVNLKLTDFDGKPFVGSTVVTVYDKALEYISGGSNVGDIKAFFWKWRRHHSPSTQDNVSRFFRNIVRSGETGMGFIGVFGRSLADDAANVIDSLDRQASSIRFGMKAKGGSSTRMSMTLDEEAPMAEGAADMEMSTVALKPDQGGGVPEGEADGPAGAGAGAEVQPTIRKEFADLAFWAAVIETDEKGIAQVELDMPENLTTWKIKTWGMGHGTKVGEGSAEVITSKDLIIRLQAPRFFVEKDEVVLSAIVHNYLEKAKDVRVVLELEGNAVEPMGDDLSRTVKVEANGEKRIDWRVKAVKEGSTVVIMKALTDEESDAMQMSYPVYVHGMLKTESWSSAIRPEENETSIEFKVPADRRPDETRLEIRYSPTIAMAMVDALPYLVEYKYDNTESIMSRFVSAVLTQKTLQRLGVDLEDVQKKVANLNPQEIGEAQERAKQWKRLDANPVFKNRGVERIVKECLKDMVAWQNPDGGWSWFHYHRCRSWVHNTAYVVHGLQVARDNDVAIVPGVLERGVKWLQNYEANEIRKLKNAPKKKHPWKKYADNMDAFVYMVLGDSDIVEKDMREFLYRDRNHLSVYAKAMFGLALHKQGKVDERDMIIRNIEQYLVHDDENQTAWLKLGNNGYWWYWYGSEYEAQAYYLKLLAAVKPQDQAASRLVKYLVNNRKHATYWSSTRDTAICVEAIADYVKATGEDKPDMTVEVLMDGRKYKEVKITSDNLFTFDNALILEGDAVDTGKHKVTLRRKGKGPLYANVYLTNFTLEDFIKKAGLEIKVERQYYKLVKVDKSIKVVGSHGQALDQKVEKYERVPLKNGDVLKSGDLVEIELVIDSKNDYEYIMLDDMKAAGFEPVDVRSGYIYEGLGAYMELRDERVSFFARRVARGKHSLSYRMRAETPGTFSALPTRANGVYAPELRANSDEIRLSIQD